MDELSQFLGRRQLAFGLPIWRLVTALALRCSASPAFGSNIGSADAGDLDPQRLALRRDASRAALAHIVGYWAGSCADRVPKSPGEKKKEKPKGDRNAVSGLGRELGATFVAIDLRGHQAKDTPTSSDGALWQHGWSALIALRE